MKWMAQNQPNGSYYVPAHLERAGPFNPNGNNGFNIEHLRNFNNAAPTVAFGFETQPGHGASDARGEYTVHRNNIGGVGNVDSVGGTTYGGTGVYGAQVGGVWDALLGEGRNWWFFASSDWHNRGMFGPDDRRSSQDFYPGEYQRDYVMVKADNGKDRSRRSLEGAVAGSDRRRPAHRQQLRRERPAHRPPRVRRLRRHDGNDARQRAGGRGVARGANNTDIDLGTKCATMGEKLGVRPGHEVVVAIAVRDPSGTNYSPYTFANPSLAQVGISQPLNQPVLDHIDVIGGMVTGYKTPGAADYSGQWPTTGSRTRTWPRCRQRAKNTSAVILRTFERRPGRRHSDGDIQVDDVPPPQRERLAVPASARHEPAGLGAVRDGCRRQSAAGLWTNATGINPTLPGGTDGTPANANLRIPCTTVGTNVPATAVTYTGTAIDGCPEHLPVVNGQKFVGL